MSPSHPMAHDMHQVTIRRALPVDAPALQRLAERDSARVPEGDVVVADVGGELVAALPLAGDAVIADPFRRTAELVRLLELRAAQIREDRAERGASRARRPEVDARRPPAVAAGR